MYHKIINKNFNNQITPSSFKNQKLANKITLNYVKQTPKTVIYIQKQNTGKNNFPDTSNKPTKQTFGLKGIIIISHNV